MWGMERSALEEFLGRGLSLEQIGHETGHHASTISYWLRRHGLEAVHRTKYAARGGIARGQLEALVNGGASTEAMAAHLRVSPSTVRHWLKRYDLETRGTTRLRAARQARAERLDVVRRTCTHHGETDYWLDARGYYRCLRCRSEGVSRRRRKVKQLLVEEAGGACRLCGYERFAGALHFHHLDPTEKTFSLSHTGVSRGLEKARTESRKCVLLCSNCHAEVEGGVATLA